MPLFPANAQGGTGVYNPEVCAKDISGAALSPACEAMIKAFPTPPNTKKIQVDSATLSLYNFWKVGPEPTATFDAPGGNVIGEIPAGFNWVNIIDESIEGWLKTQDGRWVSKEKAQPASPSYFTGVEISDGLKHPFAFILDKSNVYVSSVPGGKPDKTTGRFMKRYELVNIFSVAVDAEGWRWYMIGPNQWVKQTFVGKVIKAERPAGISGRWVAIDLYEQVLVAYEDDTPVFATLVSTGVPKFDTPEGVYKVWARLERDGMSGATGAPQAYALQSVPWVMYFNNSISLHGTYWHDVFGYRTSHGCVNVTISDARWLYQWFKAAPPDKETGEITNHVLVYSSGTYGSGVIRGQ
ncbi:MAG TPA: L,D-transpeptidase [Aggregatilineales bacterium]|nr:L,D-transpeptidase [Anaerolineales bacterium]HRE47850.1 L,D-transpeptidase [Aggregatilineales bacterium]